MTKIYPLLVVAAVLTGAGAQWPEALDMPSMSKFQDGMRSHLSAVIDKIASPIDLSGAG